MTKKKKMILIIGILALILIGILLIFLFGFKHKHTMSVVDAISETCLEDGQSEHFLCEDCDKLFLDEEGEMEVTKEELVLAALGHEIEEYDAVNPTFTKEGMKQYWKCSRCGKFFVDAACTVETKKIDLIIPVLDGDGLIEDASTSGEFATSLLKTGVLALQEGIEGAAKVVVAGNTKLTKIYRDGAEISFTVESSDDTLYQVVSVSYNGKILTAVDGVYTITYTADAPTVYIEIQRDKTDTGVTLPAIPAK